MNWCEGYLLKDRKQKTKIGTTESPEQENELGLPQGSILAPLLFIIYLNDINFITNLEFINLFADDILFSVSGKTIEEVQKKVNEFLKINKLKLNVEKQK